MIKKFQKSLSLPALSCSSSHSSQVKNSLQIRTRSLDTQNLLHTTEKSEYDSEGRIEFYTGYIKSLRTSLDDKISQDDISNDDIRKDAKNKIPEALALYAMTYPTSKNKDKTRNILDSLIKNNETDSVRKENLEYLKEQLK